MMVVVRVIMVLTIMVIIVVIRLYLHTWSIDFMLVFDPRLQGFGYLLCF